MAAAAAGSA